MFHRSGLSFSAAPGIFFSKPVGEKKVSFRYGVADSYSGYIEIILIASAPCRELHAGHLVLEVERYPGCCAFRS